MADFESNQGFFEGWKDEGIHQPRLQALLDLIREHVAASVAVALPDANFREVYGAEAKADLKYVVAGRKLLWDVGNLNKDGEWMGVYRPHEEDQLAYVFEAGAAGAGKFHMLFQAYYRNEFTRWMFRLRSSTPGRKAEYQPLQAADILAYECFRHWSRQQGLETRATRYPAEYLSVTSHQYKNMTVEVLRAGYEAIMSDVQHLGL